jgi:hypothetical protein
MHLVLIVGRALRLPLQAPATISLTEYNQDEVQRKLQ